MDTSFEHTNTPIAIIGMACRLPGADNLEQFWNLLSQGGSAVVELPPERLDQTLYFDPRKGQRGKSYAKLGAIVSNRNFDNRECPIPPQLERGVDNVHLLMCQAAAVACRHAGLDPFNLPLRNTGVYIGHAQGSNLAGDLIYGTCIHEAAQFLREISGFQLLPAADQEAIIRELVETVRSQLPKLEVNSPDVAINMIAGTISKAFRLNGPFLALNSACASSLQSVLVGARALQLGRVDMAIVGGASDCKSDSLVLFSAAQSMSETGTRPFDADADGLICGEGYVALVLKTLPRALADGDPIQAIVRGLGVSSDGKGKSLWAPRKEGQVKAMERAYRHGLDMATLQYLEAHATSTGLGDATELNALGEVLGSKFPPGKKIPISSVKANIGHALEAAGVSSLIKTVLCLQHKTFVPAINIQKLNPKIDWANAPFFIPRQQSPWPENDNGLPRRAGVNAFGIGGLNMHLVLEEFSEDRRAELNTKFVAQVDARSKTSDEEPDAVAVVGIGCILPGASDPTKFWELLTSGRDPKGPTPKGRWQTDLSYNPQVRLPYTTPTILGGYITDFIYDWRAHKLPPKQVQQADPLQFMLLEAADQALIDSGYDKKEFDRTRVGVLVGTEFGGDFAAELGLGLRLPHIDAILQRSFARRNVEPQTASAITAELAEVMLKHWPALVDESGSFSTSTLASRITKTMNLMGGAAAIDAGDTSSAAVLATSADLLLSGDCDMMICAGGQRRMNLPQYEGMAIAGVLSTSDKPRSPFDAAASGIVPGEGVAVVILKRLSDARRDGDRIRAIVRGIGAGHGANDIEGFQLAIDRAFESAKLTPGDIAIIEMDGSGLPARDQEQLRAIASAYGRQSRSEPLLLSSVTAQIGHTAGASAMVSLVKASLEVETGQVPATFGLEQPVDVLAQNSAVIRAATEMLPLRHTTHDGRRLAAVSSAGKGQAYHILLERGERVAVSPAAAAPAAQQQPATASTTAASDVRIYHVGGASAAEIAAKLEAAQANPAAAFAQAVQSKFNPADRARLAIVASSTDALAKKLQLAAKQFANPDARTVLEQQGCFYRTVPVRKPRVAFLFPGQGSHYAGMLRELVRHVPAAADAMQRIDAVMAQRGYQTFAQMAWENPAQLGADVWVTQVVMLLADVIVHAAIADLGIKPDLVAGHSYGEFAALTAADAWDLEDVVTAARARYDAIEATPTARGTLMATTAPPHTIEQTAASLVERTYLANFNAPDQTVVGGSPAALAQLSELLNAAGYKSQVLSVPCPYHTPLLEGAGALLKRTLDTLRMRPPRVPLLSSVTNRYVAEPSDVRANLAAQLTTPVRFVELIQRIAQEQDTVFVEVGPQQALTKLTRRILDGENSIGVIACDNARQPGIEQLYCVKALLECLGVVGDPVTASAPTPASRPAAAAAAPVRPAPAPIQTAPARPAPAPRSPQPAMTTPQKGTITHFDATQRRVENMKRLAAGGPKTSNGHHTPAGNGAPSANGGNGNGSAPATVRNGDTAHAAAAPTPAARATMAPPRVVAPAPAPLAPAPVAPAIKAQAATTAPATPSLNPAELEKFLINFVVEQTGYPPEVVELDADLEADLGIDSIKKAQLFGELSEYFDVQATDNLSLDDFPTLRHVLDFLANASMKGEAVVAAVAVAPVAAPAPMASTPVAPAVKAQVATSTPATPSLDPAELEKFLINFVVEQTGYPPEVVELDADLEADLGIDSIKKAQLFGELSEYFDVQATDNLSLDDFPTLRHVLNFLADAPMKGEAVVAAVAVAPVAAPAPMASTLVAPAAKAQTATAAPATPSLDPAELEKFLINFVVEQTGYPPEVVELDADLEADLGIDSIKKAQLFGELSEYFDVQATDNLSLDDFPTLRHVLNFLANASMKGDAVAAAVAVAPAPAPAPSPAETAPLAPERTAVAATQPAGAGLDPAELEKFLINFVVEQTGYPPEVVELDADLEADLGIDSIKKAQLFGELSEYFDVQATDNLSLDDFPTLRHVLDFLANSGLKKNLTPGQIDNSVPVAEPFEAPATPSQAIEPATDSATYEIGLQFGRERKQSIRALLRRAADRATPASDDATPAQFSAEQLDLARGIADGAGLFLDSILANFAAVAATLESPAAPPSIAAAPAWPPAESSPEYDLRAEDLRQDETHRFYMRAIESAWSAAPPAMPVWNGAALIVGEGPLGDALARLLASAGVTVRRLALADDLDANVAAFDEIWNEQPTPHLFIVTGREAGADPADGAVWQRRWHRVALAPYFITQRWVQRLGEANLLDHSSLVAAIGMNGNFGFSGPVTAPECGALAGLVKAVYIEVAHMRNNRKMRAKAVDAPADEPVEALAANICRELASGAVDYEVAFNHGQRFVQCAYPELAGVQARADVRPGGTWVVTGGSRGITAECALELGRRFKLKLHLIGKSPLPQVDARLRNASPEELKTLKLDVMRAARAAGKSMDGEWNRVQREVDLDCWLRRFVEEGVDVTYHACDVSNAAALSGVLDDIRRGSGPIEGIIHGAGIERAASYERKTRDSVLETIAAKVDGALHLMRLTWNDPVRWFVGFGSVSGRLGSNGQTDYCLASDTLCKLAGWYKQRRPGVRSVAFHWHPWAEIGMAARPETTAMLRITDGPTHMPKREGVDHLIRELYTGGPESEVMITTWDYHGRYYGKQHHPNPEEAGTPVAAQELPRRVPADLSNEPWPSLSFERIALRHELEMLAAPLPPGAPAQPQWQGPACILGDNAAARALAERLTVAGATVHMLPVATSPEAATQALEAIYAAGPPRYLFLMTAHIETDGLLLERQTWAQRRALGVTVPFLLTQYWFRLRMKAKDKSPVTIVAATSLGGDFGISGKVATPEGGALCGMLKSIYVEDTRVSPSEATVKVIDVPADEPPAEIAEAILRELASGDPNVEVGWSRGTRSVLRSRARPVESFPRRQVPRGGNWVITGGARGITAATAFELAKRYGLKLHLIGRSPAPSPDAPWRGCTGDKLAEVKAQIVRKAVAEGRSPEKDWEPVKYDIEIDATLEKYRAAGVDVTYYSCDLSDWDRLAATLEEIRCHGPIEGIVHGAGYGKSFRFGTGNAEAFQRTLAGKLDGAVALMSLTQKDALRYFIGFGSIGGRYGGNGLSDYAAANDMFAKLCAWYRARRPECAVCCFDWQSWDEVGMAMLGDNTTGSKGVLKMVFISPREGVEHVCRELEAGLPTTEVLITDLHFEKTFYPFIHAAQTARTAEAPAVAAQPLVKLLTPFGDGGHESLIEFDPASDPFLLDHRFRGKPLLPAVIGLEAVAETARLATGKHVSAIRDVQLVEGLMFHSDKLLIARIRALPQADGSLACDLVTDFHNRAGQLMKKDRVHLRAVAEVTQQIPTLNIEMPTPPSSWHTFEFQHNGPLYHGPTLHGVKATTFDARGGWGRLVALSLTNLGGTRPSMGWIVPATLLDAGFYVCGIHAWFHGGQAFSLPSSMEALRLGRMPREDENCLLAFACRQIGDKEAIYDFTVFGEDRVAVMQVIGHRVVMVRA